MVGAAASSINAIAGGGSLISYPTLTLGLGISDRIANATNSVGLWPGSLASGFGSRNNLGSTGKHFRTFLIPTLVGSGLGAWLLLVSSDRTFACVIPFLILLASCTLALQPLVNKLFSGEHRMLPLPVALVLQFFVAMYGGYFGAGMGIMMLAFFAYCMEGTIHELNAVKNWLGTAINLVCSTIFIVKGMVLPIPAIFLVLGAIVGGFGAAKWSQRLDPDRLRSVIVVYGLGMAAYFFYRSFA